MHPLQTELEYFAAQKAGWAVHHSGKYVLVKGQALIGVFDQPETALAEGARLYGTAPFLIRRVEVSDEPVYIPALTLGLLHARPMVIGPVV